MTKLSDIPQYLKQKAFDDAYESMNWDRLHKLLVAMGLPWYKTTQDAKNVAYKNFQAFSNTDDEHTEKSVSSGCIKVTLKIKDDYYLFCKISFDPRIESASSLRI